MRIVLPGALPDSTAAKALVPHLEKVAPTLLHWFARSRAKHVTADPAHTLCTPLEYWQLVQRQYHPQDGLAASAGLGPLIAHDDYSGDGPIWLLELVHLSAVREGAVLIPAQYLNVTDEDSTQLLASAGELCKTAGFDVAPLSATHWRVQLPQGFTPRAASPELVSLTNVNDWWSLDIAGRPWRRLSNELQMLWFDHPVNERRANQGLRPINSVWLFGGAKPGQLQPVASDDNTVIDHSLVEPFQTQDWNGWLNALQELDANVLAAIPSHTQPELVLTGHQGFVTLKSERGILAKLRRGTNTAWKKWWTNER